MSKAPRCWRGFPSAGVSGRLGRLGRLWRLLKGVIVPWLDGECFDGWHERGGSSACPSPHASSTTDVSNARWLARLEFQKLRFRLEIMAQS